MNKLEQIFNSIVSLIFAQWPRQKPSAEDLQRVKLVAHRGVHECGYAKENTLQAFRLAAHNHIWAVELDIHFTQDHIPVISHDSDCGRIFYRPDIIIPHTSFQELRQHVPELPSLKEVLLELSSQLHFMIEVKEDLRNSPKNLAALEHELASLTPLQDYHFLALNPNYLEALTFAPKASFMDVIWIDSKKILQQNALLNHGAVAGHFLFLSTPIIQNLHSQGKKVGVGFLDSRNSLYREVSRGADFIFTNHPLRLKKYLTNPP